MRDLIRWTIRACVVLCLMAAAPKASASDSAREKAPATKAARNAPTTEQPPFARVYLATRGCMSCSHCRTTIRQMLKPKTQGGVSRLGDDQVEVKYQTPQVVPLRDVIQSLANNRLHDFSVVDVLFEASGVIRSGRNGGLTFVVAETGQAFPIAFERSTNRPGDDTPVRVVSLVDGWRGKGDLSLRAKEIRAKP